MDLITRYPGTNAFIDKNEKVYCILELKKYLKKIKEDYELKIVDKTHGNKIHSIYINLSEGTLEKKDHFYTCSNKNVFRRFFTLKEAREFAKRYCKVIGKIKIDKVSEKGIDNLEAHIDEECIGSTVQKYKRRANKK